MQAAGTGVRLRRSVDATAAWQIGVLLVVWAAGAFLVGLVASVLPWTRDVDVRLVIAGWTVLGGLVFVPAVEQLLARVLLGLRRPTADQAPVLRAAWARMCLSAGVRGERYVLRVQPRGALNATAGAGHIVGVTATALALQPRQLEAVLAHELGHHLGGHAMIGMLHTWYSLPLRFLVRVCMWIGRLGSVFLVIFRFSSILTLLLLPLVLVSCLGTLLLPLVAVPVMVSTVVMRRSELRADATAARLGYGPELLALYRGWAAYEGPRPGPWRSVRSFFRDTHPRFDVRVRALERALAEQAAA